MKKQYIIEDELLIIETDIPICTLLELEIDHRINEHGSMQMKAVVNIKDKEEILHKNWIDMNLCVSLGGEQLFCGKITSLVCKNNNEFWIVELTGNSTTILLDREKKKRSFQDPEMTYKQLVEEIVKEYNNINFKWSVKDDKKTGTALIQYQETDWEFLKRICSHFQEGLIAEIRSEKISFHFGMINGKKCNYNNSEILEFGMDSIFYKNGCQQDGLKRGDAFYLIMQTKKNWEIGDFVYYQGRNYRIYQKKVVYRNGEFVIIYNLGMKGVYYQKKVYNEALAGIRLQGVVKRCLEESVYIQLDIDKEEQAGFPWDWMPETNNLSYCMPEVGTKVALYFPTKEEGHAEAILAVARKRNNRKYMNTQKKEFLTAYNKKIGLYPNKLFLQGKDGNISLKDDLGIQLHSNHGISIVSDGLLDIKGKNIVVSAPLRIISKTNNSNIELCRNINLYAVAGVNTISAVNSEEVGCIKDNNVRQAKEIESWRMSFAAMAAVPAVDLAEIDGKDMAIDLFTCGCIPKVAKGSTTISMAQVMRGTKESECSFPKVFQSMQNCMIRGGYALPEE